MDSGELLWDNLMPYLVVIIMFGLWIYCIQDIARHKFEGNSKTTWMCVMLLFPLFGLPLYLLFGQDKRMLN